MLFTPRREHARFCCSPCRAAWNREQVGDPLAGASALMWSITAMSLTTSRLPRVRPADRPRAFAVIGEAVWWITIVDATLVRHYPQPYDTVMAGQSPAERLLIEETLAGLRFVRNRIGDEVDLGELIDPRWPGSGTGHEPITGWRWKPAPQPSPGSASARGRAWEMSRYQAYQARLAGHTIGEIIARAAAFLKLAAADSPSDVDIRADAAR